MMSYKTLKEKAEEWDISLRHLQYLCLKGRLEGAIKKAGTWFVPETTLAPAQNSKNKKSPISFVGTRKKIFVNSISLFQQRGFESVSMKDIADAVGITQSALYNHFRSKNEILETIYEFYGCFYLEGRPSLEKLESVLQKGSLLDIVKSMSYKFHEEYLQQMTEITTIIFHRCAIDERARELTKCLMIDEGVRFVESVFDRAVAIGRLAPLDTHMIALLINSIRIFTLHCWIVDSSLENYLRLDEEEQNLYQNVTKLLTDLRPPGPA